MRVTYDDLELTADMQKWRMLHPYRPVEEYIAVNRLTTWRKIRACEIARKLRWNVNIIGGRWCENGEPIKPKPRPLPEFVMYLDHMREARMHLLRVERKCPAAEIKSSIALAIDETTKAEDAIKNYLKYEQ